MAFSTSEAFNRNLGLIDAQEQERLLQCRVAIVGCGGVGGVHAHTLARLGVGRFRITDPDTFSIANINRQIGATVHTEGRGKAEVTREMILGINPTAEVEIIPGGIDENNCADFVAGMDLFVDGIDVFSLPMRRQLFQAAWVAGVPALTAAPIGFSGTLHVFAQGGMSFDEYFDLDDRQSFFDQFVNFLMGLAPAALHRDYMDLSRVDPRSGKAPSSIIGSQLAACLVGAEAVRILLGRGDLPLAPRYLQFDAYRRRLVARRLPGGNRWIGQRLKRPLVVKQLRALGVEQAFEETGRG